MPEILTESFCERCGTRYTFESAAPKQKRLGRFKVLSQGFKNFVMSDDTSLDEAFAAARNDEERETVTQQLDAFHKTFNFCMNCRQYTCSNCWNEAEGRCLTCAPHLGHEILPAPFPALETNGNGAVVEDGPRLDGLAWPTLDLPPEEPAAAADLAWPVATEASGSATAESAPPARDDGLPDWASLVPAEDSAVASGAEFAPPAEPPDLETLLAHPAVTPEAEAAEAVEAVEPVASDLAAETQYEPETLQVDEAETVASDDVEETAETAPVDERAASAAAQTADLLSRFRPGQSIDAALEEYEAALAAQDAGLPEARGAEIEAQPVVEPVVEAPAPEPVAEAPAPEPATEPVAALHETPLETEAATPLDEVLAEEPPLEPEIAAAIAEPEAETPQPEPAAASQPEPAVEPAPEPGAPGATADDRVEVPVWRIVAPDTPTPGAVPGANGHPETGVPTAASAEQPEWPQTPAWPGQEAPVDVSFLAARLSRKPSNDALWAASSRDVLAPMPQQPAPPAVQTCVSCGLSLSANARFCRRCGSRQEG
jgi:hypothetical protein